MSDIRWPLMRNNITEEDMSALAEFLSGMPRLTQSGEVGAFEREWSEWLGVKHSVFVNSGSSANLITMSVLRERYGEGEVVVPPLTWVSDIASVLQCGFTPVFADIDPRTLGMSTKTILSRLSSRTKAVFLTHVQGFNALTRELLDELAARNIPLIEDVCESHGARFAGRKCGVFGLASNFSFYYAHHMSTIEGGMISTDDDEFYEMARMFRSHGMVREAASQALKDKYAEEHSDLSPDFIFAFPAFNMRNTEIGGFLGRRQLRRLDGNIEKRNANLRLFVESLDPRCFRTDFELNGCSNYAFPLVLKSPDEALRDKLEKAMRDNGVEFRRGSSGGGNQLRQPYLRKILSDCAYEEYPEVEHIHFFGYYIGNYPDLGESDIRDLCVILNGALT